ncbi:MAG: hypothetical protein ABEK50_06895 [bacterium]
MKAFRRLGVTALLIVFTGLLTVPAGAQFQPVNANLEFQGGMQVYSLSGTTRSNGGSDVDVKSDMGLSSELDFELGLRYQSRQKQGFRFSWSRFNFTGNRTLDRNITYSNKTFSNGTDINSKLNVQFIDIDSEYRLTQQKRDDFFNITSGARIIDYEGEISSTSKTARSKFTGGLPVLGFSFRKYFDPGFFIAGRYQWMDISFGSNDWRMIDGEASVAFNPVEDLWIMGSYNDFNIEGSHDEDSLDMDYRGPNIRALLYF